MTVEFNPETLTTVGSPRPAPPATGPVQASSGAAGLAGEAKPVSIPNPDVLNGTVERANQALSAMSVSLRFRVDGPTDQIVVSVVNEATGEVVRQIPAEEQLAIEAHLQELMGVLFSKTT